MKNKVVRQAERFANRFKNLVNTVFHGHYDTSTPEGREKERARNIALTALTAAFARFIAIIIPLITVRVTLTYMGEETYGLWSAVISFFAVFAYADFGLGSGLQTELSRITFKNDKELYKKYISSTFFILTGISLILSVVFIACFPFVNWAGLVNAKTDRAIALAAGVVLGIVIPKLINIPFSIIQRTQYAMQEAYKTNLWQCFGNILSLLFVFTVKILDLGALTMIWASSMITVLVAIANFYVYFKIQKPHLMPVLGFFDKSIGKLILKTGVNFFVLSIFTSLSLATDNFILARVVSLEEVTGFSIIYKIVVMISVVCAMLSTPMWAANGEAIGRGEYGWVKKATYKMSKISLALAVVSSVGIILLIKPALAILTGSIVSVNYPLLISMLVTQILISGTSPFFMVLNASKIIRFQIAIYLVFTLVSIPLKFIFGSWFGAIGITMVGNFAYFIFLTVPTFLRVRKALNKKTEVHFLEQN